MPSPGGKPHSEGLEGIQATALCPSDGTWGSQSNGKFIFVHQARLFLGSEGCMLYTSVVIVQGSTTCIASTFLFF